jgi:hypothetical protein
MSMHNLASAVAVAGVGLKAIADCIREAKITPASFDFMSLVFDRVVEECRALRSAGQKEYAHDDARTFANFERVAERLAISREAVLLVYLEKHVDGIHSWVKGHRSQRESVKGRINDAIVILLRGMVEDHELRTGGVK